MPVGRAAGVPMTQAASHGSLPRPLAPRQVCLRNEGMPTCAAAAAVLLPAPAVRPLLQYNARLPAADTG